MSHNRGYYDMGMNPMQELLSVRQTRRLLDMPSSTVDYWLTHSEITPRIPGEGRGTSRMLTVQQAWAIGIAKAVRAGGQSVENAGKIAAFLESLPPEHVEAEFKKGRTCLLVVIADGEMSFLPMLIRPSAITNNPELNAAREEAIKQGTTLITSGIDVKPLLDQIVAAVEKKK